LTYLKKKLFLSTAIFLILFSSSVFAQIAVNNTNDTGAGSLRQAIIDANDNPGVDNIIFNIPNADPNYNLDGVTGNETWTISPVTDLPEITEGVILDATTQPGIGIYKIKIDGQGTRDKGFSVTGGFVEVYGFYLTGFNANSASAAVYILHLGGSPSTIGDINKGNVINSNRTGISISLRSGCIIKGNLIGTDETGEIDLGNNTGIALLTNGSGQIVGGDLPGEGNLISGNNIGISANASGGHSIRGNFIGTNKDGTSPLGNTDGISFGTTSNNSFINNLISGNSGSAIRLAFSSNNTIQGNIIGEGSDGSPMGNNIGIEAFNTQGVSNNTIGGTLSGEGNVIANHTNEGVLFINANSVNNVIIGNTMYCNGIGINLNGVANNNIQPPVVTSVTLTSVSGTGVDGDDIHVYRDNSGCKPMQGVDYLGTTTVSGGIWTLSSLVLDANDKITATATNSVDGTSEFWKAPFITTWKTDNFGITEDNQIEIRTDFFGNSYDVRWQEIGGGGSSGTELDLTGNNIITFPNPGTYRVEISGDIGRFYFRTVSDANKLLSIEQWGDIQWNNLSRTFRGCDNMQYNATDAPDLTFVTDISEVFYLCEGLNDMDLTNWDVSGITNMQGAFYLASNFNGDISSWDVSNVTDFSFMLGRTDLFNGDLSGWDVRSGENFQGMFVGALAFNSDISNWVTESATNMSTMFKEAESFNQDLSGWDVDQVTNFSEMFYAFNGATSFDGDVSTWVVSSGTDFSSMFFNALNFNQNLSSWTPSSATNMERMFYQAVNFNQDLSSWDVSSVTNMAEMFRFAGAYDQSLANWDITSVDNMTDMLSGSALSLENYDATLTGWATIETGEGPIPSGITFGAAGLNYCAASTDRQSLINDFDWTITDGGPLCPPLLTTFEPIEAGAGTQVTIRGTDFTDVSLVTFGTVEAASFDVISTTEIRAVVGAGATGEVVVTTPGGTASLAGFIFIDPPSITSFTPPDAGQGETVTIIGTNFEGTSEVSFGSMEAASFTVNPSGEIITAEVGSGTSGSITVVTPGGSATIPGFIFNGAEIDIYAGADNSSTLITLPQASPINFGDTLVGSTISRDFLIENNGNENLVISSITISAEQFTLTSASSLTIPPSASELLTIEFTASSLGTFGAAVNIISNDDDEGNFSFEIEASAAALEPEIEVINASTVLVSGSSVIEFGSSTVGTDVQQQLVVNNLGTADLNINSLTFSGGGDFSVSPASGVVPVGGNLNFTLTLSAAAAGSFTDRLTINSNDADEGTFTIDLQGIVTELDGQEISVIYNGSPLISGTGLIDFGEVIQGQPTSETLTIENTGTNDLVITEILLADGAVFSFEELGFPLTLLPGESLAIILLLDTDVEGLLDDTMTIISNDPDLGSFVIDLEAVVNPIPFPRLEVRNAAGPVGVSSLVELGTTDESNALGLSFELFNLGTAELLISAIGSSSEQFAVSGIGLPASIAAGLSTSFDLAFSAGQVGAFESTISIASNDPAQDIFSFNVRAVVSGGQAVVFITNEDNSIERFVISNEDIDLGQTLVDLDIVETFGIENLSESEALQINSITTDNPLFTLSNIPASVAAGGLEEFSLTLNSRRVGINSARVTISTSINDFSFNAVAEVIAEDEPELTVYNVITPNGDGRHDFLFIENITEYTNNSVTIFNRLGNKVFEVSSYNNDDRIFEGISDNGNELLTGNYYYVIDKGNGDKRLSGFLIIKR
jgi:gliding motility-associated-like protein